MVVLRMSYVCVCVYDYVQMLTNVDVCMHVYVFLTYLCMYICIYVRMYACMYVCMQIHIAIFTMCVYMQSYSNHVYTSVKWYNVCMCVYTHTVNPMQVIFLEIGRKNTAYVTEAEVECVVWSDCENKKKSGGRGTHAETICFPILP